MSLPLSSNVIVAIGDAISCPYPYKLTVTKHTFISSYENNVLTVLCWYINVSVKVFNSLIIYCTMTMLSS